MKVISFYSFKGGTGRTTTAANVAGELARRGRSVIVIDLDIDGPGLEIVFGTDSIPLYIQDLVKAPSSTNLDQLIYDMKNCSPFKNFAGNLYLIAANLDVQAPVQATSDVFHDIISTLLTRIRERAKPAFDFCILDSQSGYTDLSATVLDVSDHLFLLSRFSRQHVMGTVAYAQFLNHLITKRHLRLTYDVVMSLVPPAVKQEERRLHESYLRVLNGNVKGGVLLEIPEAGQLKWRERVIVAQRSKQSKQTVEAFQQLADHCEKLN
jgi:MinD-like ATPase involved in chromosome partitioning or flagellar assembly